MKTEHKKQKMGSIKHKMFGYVFMIIILMMALSIYSLGIMNLYKGKIDAMFVRNIMLQEISDQIGETNQELLVYLSTKSSTSLNKYMRYSDLLREMTDDLENNIVDYTEEELMVLDIKNMVTNYLEETDLAVEDKRRSDIDAYMERYDRAQVLSGYILSFINELNTRQLSRNSTNYLYMAEQVRISNILNIVLIIDLIILSVIIVLKMANKMITPIVKLSHSAEEIARGKFSTDIVLVETSDEIEILSRAFNRMKYNIQEYIETVKEKAKTEAKLKDQMVENLKMQSLLDNARLYALQSQMNPHFLFNTINAGVQMAMIEGADKTSEFLESMSRLFRYNIQKLDQVVTLREELQNVKDYYQMLKVRFDDLILFEFFIDESACECLIPPLTLQPIVENAYIHGLSKLEEGGKIQILVKDQGDYYQCIVEDNGSGMTDDIRSSILNHSVKQSKVSNGIGMQNVIERLELFYKEKNLLEIVSELNQGTKVIIHIPHMQEAL